MIQNSKPYFTINREPLTVNHQPSTIFTNNEQNKLNVKR